MLDIVRSVFLIFAVYLVEVNYLYAGECDDWQNNHPAWLWCDSFEVDEPLLSRYQDVNTNGLSRSTDDAFDGEASLRQRYQPDQSSAGWIAKIDEGGFPDHVFYRWYHKFDEGFSTYPPKMARAGHRQHSGSWSTVFMVYTWMKEAAPTLDVYSITSTQGKWFPVAIGDLNMDEFVGQWVSFEVEIKLNQPGQTDGHYRLWVNDQLLIERTEVDLRGATEDKINEIMLDTYWNNGADASLNRYYDNFVISTEKIGPMFTQKSPPLPPSSIGSSTLE